MFMFLFRFPCHPPMVIAFPAEVRFLEPSLSHPWGRQKWISRGAAQLPRLPDRVFDLTQNSRDRIGYNHSLSHILLPISRQDP